MSSIRVLFLCTHNSARSQIAEALLRSRGGGDFEVESAGTEATLVRPHALTVLAEIGIDASAQTSKTLHRFLDEPFDYVITVCDAANDACPIFPNGGQREHWSLPDPSKVGGSEERQLEAYRDVRDDLEIRIMDFIRRARSGATA
ncbi:MAG: arsenate reductase ArsC [bacterium]|nr:arsenate reductase ArsC [Chloroflexota bacterium]NBO52072.1 arsenate reductase ArsC [Candidatus Aquidulcis sp.]